MNDLQNFLCDILPDSRDFDRISNKLNLAITNKLGKNHFQIYVGKGNNGKTMFMKLIEKSFDCGRLDYGSNNYYSRD
jgi:hypothetical protein